MPLVRIPPEVMFPLVRRVRKSTVSITGVEASAPTVGLSEEVKGEASAPTEERKEEVEPTEQLKEEVNKKEKVAGTGYIVHCSDTFTVVAVHRSFKFQGQKAIVKFWEGTKATDTKLIELSSTMNLIVAHVPRGDWQEVEYAQIRGFSQDLISVVSLFRKLLPFVGRVISPRCIRVDRNGKEIPGTKDDFTFNLPLAGELGYVNEEQAKRFEMLRDSVLGAPIFNIDGRFVGFVLACGETFDFKYGKRSDDLRGVMHTWLAGRQWKDAIRA